MKKIILPLLLLCAAYGHAQTTPEEAAKQLIDHMVYVEGGTYTMGTDASEKGNAWDDEFPAHQVTLRSFYIGRYEVTQAEWEAIMGSNPASFKGAQNPVECVSWDDCQAFIDKLNRLTGKHFRLPTEAEWEYAARGGRQSKGYTYAGSNTLEEVAWFFVRGGRRCTNPVGQKKPNELGLYDMTGNVCEWCHDWLGNYSEAAQTDPTGPATGQLRIYRGGSWRFFPRACRVSQRDFYYPAFRGDIIGLRLACTEL